MKIFNLLIISLTITIFSFIGNVNASHISGGDITYQCVGQDSFLVTLNLFRDCAGIAAPTISSVNFHSTCGGSVSATLSKESSFEISQLCPTQIINSTCSGGSWPGQEQHVYRGIVVLSAHCNYWTLSWESCCRNAQISNLINPNAAGNYISSTMYSGIDSCNNSPIFSTAPIPYSCVNKLVEYNLGVIEPDGDSVAYFMAPSFVSSTNLVAYSGTYTYLQPIAGANLVLNSSTGQLSFTPTLVGVYSVTVRVEEYDRGTGVLKGKYYRDFQVFVQNCSNSNPTLNSSGITNYQGDGSRINSNNIEVCGGDNFSFDLVFSDANTSDLLSVNHNILQVLDSSAVVTITNSNPLTLNVSWVANTSSNSRVLPISITVKDNACPIIGSGVYTVNIKVSNATVASNSQTLCFGEWADLVVSGGTSFGWSVISGSAIDTNPNSATYNMTCSVCDNPSVSPQVTTTYVVVSNLQSSCLTTDTVTITVAPNFVLSMPNDTIICNIDSVLLQASVSNSISSNTYIWTPGGYLNFDTILSPLAGISQNTNFNLKVTSSQGCEKSGVVSVDLAGEFPPSITIAGDTVTCQGESVPLTVDLGSLTATCGISTAAPIGSVQYAVIGTGTSTNATTSYPAPYSRLNTGSIHQILFRASELHAMGMGKGRISSLSFYVTTVGSLSTLNNYEVKMKCTSQNVVSMIWETGFTVVSPASTHIAQTGWNEHVFATPFEWDGVSNLLMQFCTRNATNSPTGSSLTRYTNTSFNSVGYDGSNAANVCSTITGLLSTKRPNVRFKYTSIIADPLAYTYLWSPNNGSIDTNIISTPIVSPTVNTTYNVIVTDTLSGCFDTLSKFIAVVSEYDAGFVYNSPYCLNDPIDMFVPIFAGGIFTGAGMTSNDNFNPSSAGVGTWPINYNTNSGNACNNDSTMLVQVLPLPDATINEIEICLGSAPVNLTASTPGGVWSGNQITDILLGTFDPSGFTSGSYTVYYEVTTSCTNYDTATINVIEPYTFNIHNSSISVCEGESVDLATNYTLSSNPLQGNGPVKETWTDANGYVDTNGVFDASNLTPGTYTVTLEITGLDGACGSSQTMNVEVRLVEFASALSDLSYCESQTSAKIYVTPWLFGTGVSFSQRPLGSLSTTDTLMITSFGQNGKFDATVKGVGDWEIEFTYVNSFGCVGVVVDTLNVLPEASNAVTNNGSTVAAVATGGYTYQWLDCKNGNAPIAGAISQSYTPGRAGKFAVEILAGSCKVTSACEETWPLSVGTITTDLGVSLYPNPVQNELRIDKGNNDKLTIVITDNAGKVVYSKESNGQVTIVDMSDFASGLYFVKMRNENGSVTKKIVKK